MTALLIVLCFSFVQSREEGARKRITLNINKMKLEEVLKAFSKQTGANFITSDTVKDRIFSAYLENVILEDALEALLDSQGLSYEQFSNSNIYVIKEKSAASPRVVTKVYKLKFVQVSNVYGSGSALGGGARGGIKIEGNTGPLSAGEAKGSESNLMSLVRSALSENGKLEVDPYTNALIITDIPGKFSQVQSIIDEIDVLVPQIYIEAEIIETDIDNSGKFGFDFGLSTGILSKLIGPSRVIQYPTVENEFRLIPTPQDLVGKSASVTGSYGTNAVEGTSYGVLSFQEFQIVLKAIETSGKATYLAKPKVLTSNNKPAIINVVNNTAIGIQSASYSSQTGLLIQTAERQNTGIVLIVTPQLNDTGYVNLMIETSVSRPKISDYFPTAFVDPQTTQVKATVRVKDGETVLLGGLITKQEENISRKVPILGDIPLVGLLFSSSERKEIKRELMTFITPYISGKIQSGK
jgi:type IV pilus assembly protein PilQ